MFDLSLELFIFFSIANIEKKSKIPSETQDNLLTVSPCIVKDKLYYFHSAMVQYKFSNLRREFDDIRGKARLKPSRANVKPLHPFSCFWKS